MVADTATITRPTEGRRRLAGWAFETWPVVVVAFAAMIAVSHIVQSSWGDTFFYNGDSVVLPMIEESLQRGEAFSWRFSSQNFFFPEGLLFFLSTLFTDSARVALITNAVLNVVALYALLRIIARQLAHHSRHRFVEITIAMAATLLFVTMVLLEPADSINRSGVATLFLFTTYYYGVILVGLAVVSLTLWVTHTFGTHDWDPRRVRIYLIAVTVLGGLASFSDPLYLAQVVAPFGAAALILVFLKRLTWRRLLTLAIPAIAGTIIGFILRFIFRAMFASSIGSYLSLENIPNAVRNLRDSVLEMLSTASGSLKLLMLVGILLATWAILIYALYARRRVQAAAHISTAEVFLVAFVAVSSLSLVGGQIVTGSITTRYLEPLFVFPLLTVVSVGVYVLRRLLLEVENADLRRDLSRFMLGVAVAASALIVAVGAINLPPVIRAAEGTDYTAADCFNDFVGDRDVDGVGSFWTVRALDLYGDSRGEVLQANAQLAVFDWMVNIASYEDRTFSYAVVDDSGQLPVEALEPLGEPADVIECSGYEIYDYEGTAGEQILTDRIAESVSLLLD